MPDSRQRRMRHAAQNLRASRFTEQFPLPMQLSCYTHTNTNTLYTVPQLLEYNSQSRVNRVQSRAYSIQYRVQVKLQVHRANAYLLFYALLLVDSHLYSL